jgi:glycosyltransferase involved in cell wall biosynthesis
MEATATITDPIVSVIVPARNEEISLGDCLASLVTQAGITFEIIVVDDHSTDRTREIAASFPSVRVIEADSLPSDSAGKNSIAKNSIAQKWTGKNNAVATGARAAQGEWLLFTDADTVHLPGSLARAVAEARENGADLLSYSPEQIAVTFWERAILPVVFAELARQYSPAKVNDPLSPIAAANGQYILVRREAYDAVGGHAAVAENILEDVALARAMKSSGRKIRFRYAADAVRTRMYRSFTQLREGWTKNLALLFPNPGWLAAKMLILWTTLWIAFLLPARNWWLDPISIFWAIVLFYLFERLRKANFPTSDVLWAILTGMPLFAYLLLRSKRAHSNNLVIWKGRTYSGEDHFGADVSDNNRPIRKIAENKIAAPTTAGRSL